MMNLHQQYTYQKITTQMQIGTLDTYVVLQERLYTGSQNFCNTGRSRGIPILIKNNIYTEPTDCEQLVEEQGLSAFP